MCERRAAFVASDIPLAKRRLGTRAQSQILMAGDRACSGGRVRMGVHMHGLQREPADETQVRVKLVLDLVAMHPVRSYYNAHDCLPRFIPVAA